MTDWYDTLAQPLAAVEHGVAAADDFFGSVHDGPLDFSQVDYPAAQTYVESLERLGGTDYEHAITTVLYFDWQRDTDTRDDIYHPVAAVIEETLAALADVDCITDYRPDRLDFFTGEPASGTVLAVQITFRATTLLDPGTFGDG
jgi:hypothetical protein